MDAIAKARLAKPAAKAERGLRTLGAWLALSFSASSVLLTVLLSLVIERTASEGVASSIGANLAELASQTANRLDRGMFERYREMQLMSGRLARLQEPAQVQAELDAAKGSYRYYAWLGVADNKGVVQAASEGVQRGADITRQPWFSRGLAAGHLGDVHESPVLPRGRRAAEAAPPRFYDVAFPLQRAGQPAGVLAAHVSWDWARDVRRAVFGAARSDDVEPLIISRQGVVLLGPSGTEGQRLQLPSLRAVNAGQRGFVRERWPDGEEYVVGYAPSEGFLASPGLGWKILVRQDVDSAYATLRTLQWRVFFGGLALAILFSVLGWLGARKVARPLLELAGAARRLERGGAVPVPISSAYREVEVLGAALNSLVGNLKQKTGELHALNAQLEQRVERRTAELRAAFERVRANEQRIQTIIEAAQDPFIGMDLEGRITDWSTQAEVVFGWTREEALGRRAGAMLLPARHVDALDSALQLFLQTGKAQLVNRPIERLLIDRSGREFPAEIKIGLVNTGDQRFFAAFVHDISPRKEVERLKDEFISTVSHELRTPLTAIYGALNLLASGMGGELPADARQLLSISHESTERLIRLINDMLDLEKIASGEIEYRMQRQPLRALVEQAMRDSDACAANLKVQVRLDGQADAAVFVDADRIVQVVAKLLSNAAKFSPEGGSVAVEIALRDNLVRVAVVDHGPGVPPEFHDRVFQRFAQADASDRRTRGGTGLGLAISRSIVEAHGGRIGFNSEPGVRTEFFFELPVAA